MTRRRAAPSAEDAWEGRRWFSGALALLAVLRLMVFDLYSVPSESMSPTIMVGDRLVATRTWGLAAIRRGQIVTFLAGDGKTNVVKRVIATAGDVVDIREGRVFVDGTPLEEPYLETGASTDVPAAAVVTYPHTVAEGHVWVMGDNRAKSKDSRYIGDIPVGSVMAIVWLVY